MAKKATEYFKLTEEELDALIEKRLSEGWKLGGGMITPPDERINWCAMWIPYKDIHLPHWIMREKNESSFSICSK